MLYYPQPLSVPDFVRDKSSSTLKLLKGKSSDLYEFIKYFNGVVVSTLAVVVSTRLALVVAVAD